MSISAGQSSHESCVKPPLAVHARQAVHTALPLEMASIDYRPIQTHPVQRALGGAAFLDVLEVQRGSAKLDEVRLAGFSFLPFP